MPNILAYISLSPIPVSEKPFLRRTSLVQHRQYSNCGQRSVHRECRVPLRHQTYAQQSPFRSPVEFTFDIPGNAHLFQSSSSNSLRPILLYICGLGADIFPQCQAIYLRQHFTIVSLGLAPSDNSDWPAILDSALSRINILRARVSKPITIVAESFGAVFALRLLALAPPDTFDRQFLINPATAVQYDSLLIQTIKLLPLLQLDPTQRLLYSAASTFFLKVIIADESRLSVTSFPSEVPLFRGIDINRVPLSSLLHRLRLLTECLPKVDNDFIRKHATLPTTLIASGRDRLLQSRQEIRRLANILPCVERQILLPSSSHTALFERDVDLRRIIFNQRAECVSEMENSEDWQNAAYSAAAELGRGLFAPWRRLTSPKVTGQRYVKQAVRESRQGQHHRPILLVGNHGSHGVLDTSLLFIELGEIIGQQKVRPLADPIHFTEYGTISGGRWTNFVRDLGGVRASPKNFCQLLSQGEMILLFPGGGREVCRRRGEENTVIWQEKANFIRIAAKYDAIIVPFSTVGADDSVEILLDGEELKQLPWIGQRVRDFLEERGLPEEHVAPVTTPPRPVQFYFKFHDPIDTMTIDNRDKDECRRLFHEVKQTVQTGINDLMSYRETGDDQSKSWLLHVMENSGQKAFHMAHTLSVGLENSFVNPPF